MMKNTLRLHSVKDEFLARSRIILAKGHGNNYSIITGKDGFNPYDRIQMQSFVDQLNELTDGDYDVKDEDIRREIRKISTKIGRFDDESMRPSMFYFRLPDLPEIKNMAKK